MVDLEVVELRIIAEKYNTLLDSLEAKTMALKREVLFLQDSIPSEGVNRRLAIIEAQLEIIIAILVH